jgi:hypothetical protein
VSSVAHSGGWAACTLPRQRSQCPAASAGHSRSATCSPVLCAGGLYSHARPWVASAPVGQQGAGGRHRQEAGTRCSRRDLPAGRGRTHASSRSWHRRQSAAAPAAPFQMAWRRLRPEPVMFGHLACRGGSGPAGRTVHRRPVSNPYAVCTLPYAFHAGGWAPLARNSHCLHGSRAARSADGVRMVCGDAGNRRRGRAATGVDVRL